MSLRPTNPTGRRIEAAGTAHRGEAFSSRARRLSRLGRFRLRTLDLYVARIFLTAYVICTLSFVGLFVLVEAFGKLDRFLRQDSTLVVTILKYHMAMIPTAYASYLGPVVTLAAGMFTMTTLNGQNEITPIKAAGVSIYRAMAPVFVLAACVAVFSFFLKELVLPHFREPIRSALALSRARPLNPPPYYDQERDIQIRVSEYSTTRRFARGIEISEQHPNLKLKQQISANQMEWVPLEGGGSDDGTWILHAGSIQRYDENGILLQNASAPDPETEWPGKPSKLTASFSRMELCTSLRPVDLETSDLEISYLSWRDLKRQFQRQPYHRHLAVKLHHHFSFPLSHVVLLFLGIPFILNFRSRNLFMSLAASFGICALFYLVSSISMSIGNHSEILRPILAAWLPVLLFGSLGITLLDNVPT